MYKMKKRDGVFLILFSAITLFVGYMIIGSKEFVRSDIEVFGSFLVNFIISYLGILNAVRKHNYSFDVMFWLFNLFFFFIAPFLQFVSNTYSWNLKPYNHEIVKTNILITLWYIFYIFGHSSGKRRVVIGNRNKVKDVCDYKINRKMLNIFLLISILIVVYYIVFVGFTNLFVRSTNTNLQIESKALMLLTNHGFHNFLLFTAVLHVLDAKLTKIRMQTVIAVVCFLIGCFPTGIARNMMASFYCGMLIIVFDKARKKRWITWLILLGLVFVFPAVSLFRHLSTLQTVSAGEYIVNSIQGTYLTGDYDAHQMFISIQRWVDVDGFSLGKQLLGAICFFIPRNIWPGKALGTGQTAFTVLRQHWYTNVSAPLPAEGYVNFGVIGIIVFAFLIGYLVCRFDKKYWKEESLLSRIRIIYPFSMLMFFFVCRGDLQSTGSYFLAQIIVGALLYRFAIIKVYTYK